MFTSEFAYIQTHTTFILFKTISTNWKCVSSFHSAMRRSQTQICMKRFNCVKQIYVYCPKSNANIFLLASNTATNVRHHMIQIKKFLEFTYKVVKSSDSTSKCSQSVTCTRTMCCDRVHCCHERNMENIHKYPSNVNGSATVHRSTTAGWKKRSLTKQEKQSTMICLTLAILSQLLALRHCYMLMPSFIEINRSQCDKWQ